jgi:hypothetical protein
MATVRFSESLFAFPSPNPVLFGPHIEVHIEKPKACFSVIEVRIRREVSCITYLIEYCERSSCTRLSTLGFFHQSSPPRSLIHGLKPFRIFPRICRKNRQYSNFSVVNDPAEIGF